MNPHNQKPTGNYGEKVAKYYLLLKGYQVIEQNFHVKGGEIDIIARQGKTIVFVEVKTRHNFLGGYPEEAVTKTKLRRINLAAACYLQRFGSFQPPSRLDVISVHTAGLLPRVFHIKDISAPV